MNVSKTNPTDLVAVTVVLTTAEVKDLYKEYSKLSRSTFPVLDNLAELISDELEAWDL